MSGKANPMRKILAAFGGLALSFSVIAASALPTVDVYKSASCGCCGKWVEHLRQNGFEVKTHDTEQRTCP